MNHPEANNLPRVDAEIVRTPDAVRIATQHYEVLLCQNEPYMDIRDHSGETWMRLHQVSDIDTDVMRDTTLALEEPDITSEAGGITTIRQISLGGNGQTKEAVWHCHEDFIEYYVIGRGYTGKLDRISLGGGHLVGPKQSGLSMSEQCFESVFNPQPSDSERRMTPASEQTPNTVHGAWQAGQRREFLNVPPVYAFSKRTTNRHGDTVKGPYLAAGITTPLDKQLFHTVRYNASEDGFYFDINYDRNLELDGQSFVSPTLLLHFEEDARSSLEKYSQHAREIGHLPAYSPPTARLGRTGMRLVEWGSNDERARALNDQGQKISAAEHICEEIVRHDIATWQNRRVPISSVTIDDKWQQYYGTNTPDQVKFPDMSAFISELQSEGIQVGLWYPAYEIEGLDESLCVVDHWGRSVSGDPSYSKYLKEVADQAESMVSPDGLNADFLKIDFTANIPHGPGLHWHGDLRGNAAQHALLEAIHTRAKKVKPSAVIQTQFANPWFSDVMDELRLNDAKEHSRLVRDMAHRAMLGYVFLPNHQIDPDGWPIRDKRQLLSYVRHQPELAGVVTMHYVDRVGKQLLSQHDISEIRRAVKDTLKEW
jgi:hypothetical protein